MKPETEKRLLPRLVKLSVAIVALPIIALAPAYLASVMLTDHTVELYESTEQATNIDVNDIDENGTVMYTVSPMDRNNDTDTDFTLPADIVDKLRDADLIKITITDEGTESTSDGFVGPKVDNECSFTLNLQSVDGHDARRTGTYTGYLRIEDDGNFTATYSRFQQPENCGLYVTYAD